MINNKVNNKDGKSENVCVCVCERETERDRETERQRERLHMCVHELGIRGWKQYSEEKRDQLQLRSAVLVQLPNPHV